MKRSKMYPVEFQPQSLDLRVLHGALSVFCDDFLSEMPSNARRKGETIAGIIIIASSLVHQPG